MQKNGFHAQHRVLPRTAFLPAVLLPIVFVLLSGIPGNTEDKRASNTHPLAFGKDQAIIDLQKVAWEPLTGANLATVPFTPART
jgi:hypothetical protein